MLSKTTEEKIKRQAELLLKQNSVGLTLTESWELINLNAMLDLMPMIEALNKKHNGDIEEE